MQFTLGYEPGMIPGKRMLVKIPDDTTTTKVQVRMPLGALLPPPARAREFCKVPTRRAP